MNNEHCNAGSGKLNIAELAFRKLALEWNALASEKKDNALPRKADELSLACLLLAVEWGKDFSYDTIKIIENNIHVALGRWSVSTYATSEALPWQLCSLDKTIDGKQYKYVPYLVNDLTHNNSATRTWMMELAWMVRPWLDRDQVLPKLLKNVADTLGGVRIAMGLANGLCPLVETLEIYISEVEPEQFEEQYAKRIKQFQTEGFALSESYLWKQEAICRKHIENAVLGEFKEK